MEITSPAAMTRPGKSAMAVGQMAKAAVAEAREAGADLPKNAQGLAASGIARGAEPSSIFAALVAPPADDTATPDPVPEQTTVAPPDDTSADVVLAEEVPPNSIETEGDAPELIVTDVDLTSNKEESVALALLSEATDPLT